MENTILNYNPENDDFSLYETIKKNPDMFSKWFPKVKDCGIKVPKTAIIPVPEDVFYAFFHDNGKKDTKTIAKWVKESVMPVAKDFPWEIFIKNGVFSDKFTFSRCHTKNEFYSIVSSVMDINYSSLCLETDGETELVIREYIGMDDEFSYKIYDGMPLRPEFRVFYDFDGRKILYVVNYWDYDYCHEAIERDETDGLVYNHAYGQINRFFMNHKDDVVNFVDGHMKNVDMNGIWSVDIMWAKGEYWLIDMARGFRSAYYDPEKIKEAI